MPEIGITVSDRVARPDVRDVWAVCGNSDYTITWSLDAEWSAAHIRTAVFVWRDRYTNHNVPVIFEGTSCPMPAIPDALVCAVGLWASVGEGEDHILRTTSPAMITMRRSSTADTDRPIITQDVYDELLAAVNAALDAPVQAATEQAAIAAGHAERAANSASAAAGSAIAAAESAASASASKTAAAGSASAAHADSAAAITAKNAAETAQGIAEEARDTAVSAKNAAETAQRKAETAQGKSETAKTAAEAAAQSATGSASRASASATAAGSSATSAAGSASSAHTDAAAALEAKNTAVSAKDTAVASKIAAEAAQGAAANAATNASGSATAAANSATAAANSATASANSATAAAASAAAAAEVEARAEEVADSIPEDYSELSGEVVELKSAIYTQNTLSGWEKGGYRSDDGTYYADESRIRCPENYISAAYGTAEITTDTGYNFSVFAWDLSGTFVGSYHSDGTFTPTIGAFLVSSFDCGKFPNYKFRVVVARDPASTSIAPDEGIHLKCIDPTDKSLSVEGKAADAKSTGKKIDAISSALDDITDIEKIPVVIFEKTSGTTDLPEGTSSTPGYLRNMTGNYPGDLAGTGSSANVTFWWQANRNFDAYVSYTQGTNRQLCIFQGSPYGKNNRVTPVYASNDSDNPLPTKDNPVHVESGQYLTFSIYNLRGGLEEMHWQIIEITNGDSSLKSALPLTAQMENQVDEKYKYLSDSVLESGYMQIPSSLWARHAWDGYSTTDSRNYRVRCTKAISYPYDVVLMADEGFYLVGYFAGGGQTEQQTIYTLRANTELHLYIRRINEDSSETADVAEFANALKIQTKLSNINIYQPTFTDVSMFVRMGICGDSYAAGGGIISGVRPLTWGKNLERQAGITVDIYAKSGQNIVQWNTDTINGLPALLTGTECGLYWMQHGINGTSTPEALGTPEDMSTTPHPATFYGQYVEAIEQIKTHFPYARIALATIIGSGYNLYQTTYKNVNTAIKEIAAYCEVMLIDVVDDDFYKSQFYDAYARSNHPTAMQNAGIAMANRRLISKCIQDNPSYFINYGANW